MLCLSFRVVSAKAVILHPFSLLSPKGMENRLSFSSRRRDTLSFMRGYLEVWRYRSCDNAVGCFFLCAINDSHGNFLKISLVETYIEEAGICHTLF